MNKKALFLIKSICLIILYFGVNISFAQTQTAKITGRVTDVSGEPLIGATILISELQKGSITDTLGNYIFINIQNGTYQLQVRMIGYETITKKISVKGNAISQDFILQPELQYLKEVIVLADPFKSGPKEQSMTIKTVNRKFLEENNSNSFVNSLKKIPGINAITTGVGIAKPVIRGLNSNRVIVNDHGIKQEGQQWGSDHGLEIDQYAPERVEIIKGPMSLLYGSDGMGGIINILPPVLPEKNTLFGSALATYKSNNELYGSSLMLQGNFSDIVFRLRFSTQDFGDYQVPAESFTYNRFVLPIYDNMLKNTAGNERNFTTMVGISKDWGSTTITASNFHQKSGFFPGALGIPREYQLTRDGNSRNIDLPRQVTNHFKLIANSNVIFGNDRLKLDIGYQNNHRKEESNPHAHGKGPRPEGTLALGLELHTITTNMKYYHSFNERFNGVYGFQSQYQVNNRDGFEFLLSDFTSGSAGAFFYHEYNLNKMITLNGGGRYDFGFRNIESFLEPIYNDNQNVIEYNERTGAINRNFSNFSGSLGASYYPDRKFNAKLNLGSSFRMPTAPELSSNGIHHGTFRHEFGDSTLTSERGWQIDINLTYLNKNFHFSLTPFYNYFEQYIYLGPTSLFSPLPEGGQIYRYRQDNSIFTGTEANLEYNGWKNWHVKTGVEYIYNYNLNTGLALPFTPPLSILGDIDYTIDNFQRFISEISLGLSAQHFAAQNRVDRNELSTPGYTLIDLSCRWDLTIKNQNLSFRVSILNLTNMKYLNHLSRYRLLNLPEQGRSFNVMIKIPFNFIKASK